MRLQIASVKNCYTEFDWLKFRGVEVLFLFLVLNLASNYANAQTAGVNTTEIPPLVKHLPDWEKAQRRAAFVKSLAELQAAAGNRPALETISLEAAEAVTATYDDGARLVIIEYFTPQLATENDRRATARINELRASDNARAPSAYRRVGNYLVFVFDAPSAEAGERLVSQVKYEQEVRWLGEYPYAAEDAQRRDAVFTADIIITTLKASGLTLIVSLCLGSVLGALVFLRRRAHTAGMEAFSDAGGMVRLNIDDITPQTDPQKLLGQGNKQV